MGFAAGDDDGGVVQEPVEDDRDRAMARTFAGDVALADLGDEPGDNQAAEPTAGLQPTPANGFLDRSVHGPD